MSSLPPPPPPPPWAAPPPAYPTPGPWGGPADPWQSLRPMPAEEPRPRWLVPLSVTISVVLLAGLLAAASRALDAGPDHPAEWDPRVADLAAFVEEERGLEFEHPVYVDFLTPAEYTAVTTDDGGPSEDVQRADFDDYAGQLRALGVASGELDLYEAYNRVVDSGTLAFYDPTDERIRVRGTAMSVGLEVTIVHELTHALQDQHFDLDRLDDSTDDAGASAAFRGLAEGDAVRVESAYIDDRLTEAQQAEYDEEYADLLSDSETATSEVPPFMEAVFGVPYALGQPFVTMLFNQDGNDGVDDAFKRPPDTEEHLFDPASFLAEESAGEIELDLDEDADVLEEGPFGAPSWYLFLAERIDPKVAFEAALGWNGDAYAAYEQDGEVCVKAVFVGDTDADEEEMEAALEEWEVAMVGGEAEAIEVDGEDDLHPGIEACDPGEATDLELTGRSETSLFLPNLWGSLVAEAALALGPEGSRCFARAVLAGLTYDEIVDPEAGVFGGDRFDAIVEEAFDSCAD